MGDATGGIEEAHDLGSEIGPPQPHIDALVPYRSSWVWRERREGA